jgi:hypothetical protein
METLYQLSHSPKREPNRSRLGPRPQSGVTAPTDGRGMRSPSEIGTTAELELTASMHRAGWTVCSPLFAPHARVDLVVDDGDALRRVQCRTSRLKNGAILFRACSSTGNKPVDSRGQIDVFGVWSPELAKAYLVPVGVASTRGCPLRVGVVSR